VKLDAERRLVTVGPRTALLRDRLTASRVTWIAGTPPDAAVSASAQIRHRHPAAAATIAATGPDAASVVFDEPQSAVTPGQAVVFYNGDEVLGGGWID
jgi:tRNA-specific 2-thiouridylase